MHVAINIFRREGIGVICDIKILYNPNELKLTKMSIQKSVLSSEKYFFQEKISFRHYLFLIPYSGL